MHLTRRTFVQTSLAFAAYAAVPAWACASLPAESRTLQFHNTHTGESLKAVYWEKGAYQPEALKAIDHVLRDHRNNTIYPIDPRLLDILAQLHIYMDSQKPFEVISGYRSHASNEFLHAHTTGVAPNSLHMQGRAIDIRLTDRPLDSLRDTAWAMQKGGVGFYPESRFVHIDTGDVRSW